MIKMKKVSALVLASVMVFSMGGCSSKKSPEDMLKAAVEKEQDMASIDMKGTMGMELKSESTKELNQSIDVDFSAKASEANKDSMKMSMDYNMELLGTKMDMKMYYTDGYMYSSMMGQKSKTKMDLAAMQEQLKSSTGQTNIDIKYYEDIEAKEDGDNQVISYKVNADGLKEYVDSIMSQMSSVMGSAGSSDSINISKFTGEKTIDKDSNTLEEKITMTLSPKDASQSGGLDSITITMNVQYNNIGKDVTVELPSDLDSYKEAAATTAAQ